MYLSLIFWNMYYMLDAIILLYFLSFLTRPCIMQYSNRDILTVNLRAWKENIWIQIKILFVYETILIIRFTRIFMKSKTLSLDRIGQLTLDTYIVLVGILTGVVYSMLVYECTCFRFYWKPNVSYCNNVGFPNCSRCSSARDTRYSFMFVYCVGRSTNRERIVRK